MVGGTSGGPFLFHAVPPLGLACLISLSRFFSRFETVKLAVMIPVTWSLASKLPQMLPGESRIILVPDAFDRIFWFDNCHAPPPAPRSV